MPLCPIWAQAPYEKNIKKYKKKADRGDNNLVFLIGHGDESMSHDITKAIHRSAPLEPVIMLTSCYPGGWVLEKNIPEIGPRGCGGR